ncbi:MAG TPA: hypothetical protein VKW06_07295 [Candidatus Angelobacter sp.]|nr:hypothetical protein [Candidatus Angelobacter sp.]
MLKVKLTLGGQIHEVEFASPEEFAKYVQQFGLNGHAPQPAPAETKKRTKNPSAETASTFEDFFAALSERAQKALIFIKQHPEGVDSYAVAKHLGFDGPEKLGGLFGPGIKMIANKHGINTKHIYEGKVTIDGKTKKRENLFYPRKLLIEVPFESLVREV